MQLEAKRWTRHGKDRVYVSIPDGERVGWLDLLTHEQHLQQPTLTGDFKIALQPYLRPLTPAGALQPVTEAPVPLQHPSVDEPWNDLALHRPGQLVRAEAEQHLAGMREKSKAGSVLARASHIKTDERAFRVDANCKAWVKASYAVHDEPMLLRMRRARSVSVAGSASRTRTYPCGSFLVPRSERTPLTA